MPPPQRANPARKSAQGGVSDGSPRPHPPHPQPVGSWRRPHAPKDERSGSGERLTPDTQWRGQFDSIDIRAVHATCAPFGSKP